MGTRSLTKVIEKYKYKDKNGKTIKASDVLINMYRQYDGYLEGHGMELAEFLKDIHIVNGLTYNENRKIANGAGCLAAQIVTHFKEEPGGIYLKAIDAGDCWQEYEYYITVDEDKKTIELKVLDVSHKRTMFEGNPKLMKQRLEELKDLQEKEFHNKNQQLKR